MATLAAAGLKGGKCESTKGSRNKSKCKGESGERQGKRGRKANLGNSLSPDEILRRASAKGSSSGHQEKCEDQRATIEINKKENKTKNTMMISGLELLTLLGRGRKIEKENKFHAIVDSQPEEEVPLLSGLTVGRGSELRLSKKGNYYSERAHDH